MDEYLDKAKANTEHAIRCCREGNHDLAMGFVRVSLAWLELCAARRLALDNIGIRRQAE